MLMNINRNQAVLLPEIVVEKAYSGALSFNGLQLYIGELAAMVAKESPCSRLKNGTSLDLRKVLRLAPRTRLQGGAPISHVEIWYREPFKSKSECRRVACDNPDEYADELAALVAKAQGSGNA